ncbi:MAG: right-handed parallel beta-helix repeat-containing protein [Bacteroidota bacterium]
MKKLLLIHIFILFNGLSAGAQTLYYCDPVNGSNSNNGSQASPFASFGSVNWSNVNLQDGDIIYLLDGQHGTSYFANKHFGQNLTIKAVNKHQAVVTKLQLANSSHITFQDIKFDASNGSFIKEQTIILAGTDASHITLDNCLVQAADDSSNWTKDDWYENSVGGVQFRGGNITLKDNIFLNLYHAVELRGDNSLMQNNIIENFAADAIRVLGSYGTYENNIIKNCFIDDYAIQHDDAFQAFRLDGDGKITDVVLRNNKIIIFENPSQFVLDNNLIGTLMQGILFSDGYPANWIVENNLVVNDHYHGISLYGARNCRVQNNTVVQSQLFDDIDVIPWILLDDNQKTGETNFNNIIRNNISTTIATGKYDATSIVENNIDIDESNYDNYSNYFNDYSNGDFYLKESSPAVDYGKNTDVAATDIDGNNRIFNSIVDAGCYEYSGTLGIEDEIFEENTLLVFPNPVTNSFRLSSNDLNIKKLELYDIQGKLIKSFENKDSYSIEGIEKGIYILNIKTVEGNNIYKKIIKL